MWPPEPACPLGILPGDVACRGGLASNELEMPEQDVCEVACHRVVTGESRTPFGRHRGRGPGRAGQEPLEGTLGPAEWIRRVETNGVVSGILWAAEIADERLQVVRQHKRKAGP